MPVMRPSLNAAEQPNWVDFGEDQPIDLQPTASAFADRFLRPQMQPKAHAQPGIMAPD